MQLDLTTQDWLNIIQSVGVLFTMVFTIIQLRKNNKVFKSQIFNSLYQRLDIINSLAVEHKVSNKFLSAYIHEKDEHDPVNSYIDMVGTFFYEMYYHHKNGLLSEREWNTWDTTIKKFYAYPYTRGYWEKNRSDHGYGFDAYVENLIKKR
ncbi:hypothetical protein SAMN05444008_105166 [Cnuella takakiae]|uniref:DUF4760 domain-containing protein n=1 Tax=Cnuella takakiae TaxID=1302690 RepID=A0A1M4ZCJ9_9BACT|nr:hypothetical protein [Cnuella takakiae]OLY94259.1 hypothetical protein BUE76_22010 [Cnuella takakiae]SHF15527.1 hypothetical protein SAMN05444008_105166 [Cnuella takakiae]